MRTRRHLYPILLILFSCLYSSPRVGADGTWEKFPTSGDIQGAWQRHAAELESQWPGRIRRENFRSIPYHDPSVENPLNASGVLLTYDSLEIQREGGPPPEDEYLVAFLGYDDGWEVRSRGRKFDSKAERDRFVASLFQPNPPSLSVFHVYGLDDRRGQYEGRDRKGAPFIQGWPDPTAPKLPPPVVSDRVRLTVKSTRVEEPWKDASGQLLRNILVDGTVESASAIVSRTFHRTEPTLKQGYIHLDNGTFSAKGEFIVGETNVFVLAVYNEADQNAEQTLTFTPDGQLESKVGTDESGMVGPISDFLDDLLDSIPGLEGMGDLPGPGSAFEGLVGAVVPGVVSILIGVLGGWKGPGSQPFSFEQPVPDAPIPSSTFPAGTEHTFSDGRTYREGQSYTFHDGVKYEVRQGEFVPVKQLEQGERFVDPDGQERLWQGNQAWIPSDWKRQEQSNREYAEAHQADWEVESKRVNSNVAEAMEAIKQDFEMLENLEKMRHQVIFGPRELDVLAGSDTPGGGFRGKLDRVVAEFRETGKMDREAYQQVRKVYGMAREGRILGERDLHTESQMFAEAVRGGVEGFTREVVTGADSEGKTSYKSLAVRTLTGILTGGSSEMVYTPASSVYTMKDYVDRGGDSVVEGFLSTTKDVIKGEIIGRFTGRGTQAAGKRIGQAASKVGEVASRHFPKATRAVSQKVKTLVDAFTKQRRSPFAAKFPSPPRVRPKPSPRPSRAEVMERLKEYKARPAPGLKIDEKSFTPASNVSPNLSGVPHKDRMAIQLVADRHGVKAYFRPTNKHSRSWLESGKAHPKPEMLKTKTVSNLDTQLGFSKDKLGTVACKKPVLPSRKPPDMSARQWRDLRTRYAQRSSEFLDQQTKLDALVKKGEITWNKNTGEILNAKTGKPYAGDHDAFAFVDAKSGLPVGPTVNRQINRELRSLGAISDHCEHVAWDYSSSPKTVPVGAPEGAQSPYDIAAGIDDKILTGHQAGGEALNVYDPGARTIDYKTGDPAKFSDVLGGQKEAGTGWSSAYWNGGQRKFA